MNAVACEVQVIATGARPAGDGAKRELFTEETTTALVFENGGVLKLAASVAPGQLLFLTHKESKREVVAQVTRKRDFRPTICYVEVEFSEASPGFWGVQFPDAPAGTRVTAVTPAVTTTAVVARTPQESGQRPELIEQPELVEQAGPMEEDFIGDEPATPTVAPSAQEVASLKNEVEALREQLKLLQTQTVARAAALEPSQVPADVVRPGPALASAPAPPLPKLRLTTKDAAHGPVTELSGAVASDGVPAPSAQAEAPSDEAEAAFSEEDLLPKPALNFDNVKPPRKSGSRKKAKPASAQNVAAIGEPSAMRKDLLFAAFVFVVLGAVWYENLLPWVPRPKFFGPSAGALLVAAHRTALVPARTTAQGDAPKSAKASEALTAAGSAPSAAQNERAGAGDNVKHDATPSAAPGAANAAAPTAADVAGGDKVKAVPETAADAAAPENSAEKAEVVASAKKRAATPALSRAAMVSAAEPSNEVGIVPPKLIKAVRAIASPNALQEFSTGGGDGVTFEAVVDTSGHAKPTRMISGLASLQAAATEALKKYQYEPATRHGKPVPARVTVTVKFLFEP
jgi:hypothetical protein